MNAAYLQDLMAKHSVLVAEHSELHRHWRVETDAYARAVYQLTADEVVEEARAVFNRAMAANKQS